MFILHALFFIYNVANFKNIKNEYGIGDDLFVTIRIFVDFRFMFCTVKFCQSFQISPGQIPTKICLENDYYYYYFFFFNKKTLYMKNAFYHSQNLLVVGIWPSLFWKGLAELTNLTVQYFNYGNYL